MSDFQILQSAYKTEQQVAFLTSIFNAKQAVENGIETGCLEVREPTITNMFAPGVYLRQMEAATGTIVVSHMHRTEHFLVFLTGSLKSVSENGIEVIKAPCVVRTMPGTKRVVEFLEDSVCFTIHATEKTDVDEIGKDILVEDQAIGEYLKTIKSEGTVCLGE